jgi:hypothetical protein
MAPQTTFQTKQEANFINLSNHNRNKTLFSKQRKSYRNKEVNQLHDLLKA